MSAGIGASLDRAAALHAPLAAVSSAASGADTLFIEEATRRGIPFFVLLPFHRARFRADFADADWERVEPLLEKSLNVEELRDAETAEEAYMETGVRVVDRSDLMVVVWDGKPARGLGGTADVVDYARDVGKPLITVDPVSGQLTEVRLDQLACEDGPAEWDGRPREAVEQQFELLDQDAVRHQPQARSYLVLIILLHLLAVGVGGWAFFAPDDWVNWLIGAEIIGLGLAWPFARFQRRIHRTWIHSRLSAELCRSFLATWHLRGKTQPPSLVGGSLLHRLYRMLYMAWYLDRPEEQSLADARLRYLQDRVQDQLDYFKRHLKQARLRLRLFEGSATVATVAAISLAIASLFLSVIGQKDNVDTVKLFAIVLPLASAGVVLHVVAQDYGRRRVRYSELISTLEVAARKIQRTRTWHSLTQIARETEEELLREVFEWHAVTRFAGQAH